MPSYPGSHTQRDPCKTKVPSYPSRSEGDACKRNEHAGGITADLNPLLFPLHIKRGVCKEPTTGQPRSGQYSHFIEFDQVKVDLLAQSGFGDRVHGAVLVVFDIFYQTVLLQLGR